MLTRLQEEEFEYTRHRAETILEQLDPWNHAQVTSGRDCRVHDLERAYAWALFTDTVFERTYANHVKPLIDRCMAESNMTRHAWITLAKYYKYVNWSTSTAVQLETLSDFVNMGAQLVGITRTKSAAPRCGELP